MTNWPNPLSRAHEHTQTLTRTRPRRSSPYNNGLWSNIVQTHNRHVLICSNSSNYSSYWFSAHILIGAATPLVLPAIEGVQWWTFEASPPLFSSPLRSHPAWMCPWQCNLLLWFRGHGKHHTTTVIFALKDLVPWPTPPILPPSHAACQALLRRQGGEGGVWRGDNKRWRKPGLLLTALECVNLSVTAELVLFRAATGFGAKVGDLCSHLYTYFCFFAFTWGKIWKSYFIIEANKKKLLRIEHLESCSPTWKVLPLVVCRLKLRLWHNVLFITGLASHHLIDTSLHLLSKYIDHLPQSLIRSSQVKQD